MAPVADIFRAWGKIATGGLPVLSLEITRECPLRCPGCYAYDPGHLGGGSGLRELADLRGEALIARVLELADAYRPLHLSIVGGDPLVRYRELETLLPQLLARGIFVQLVTSAFRPIPAAWAGFDRFELVVSVDGLPSDHDLRRAPATYDRILKHIAGQHVVIHCTVTAAMARPGYLAEFVNLWSANPDVKKIWMSLFTPQRGAELPEILSPQQREAVLDELTRLSGSGKLDLGPGAIAAYRQPPASPAACIFAQTTRVLSADLKTRVAPCQFGGDPDCAQCGCYASAALAAVGNYRLPLGLTAGAVFRASHALGTRLRRQR